MIRCLNSLFVLFLLFSCSARNQKSDAYGNFETVETIISSEVQGVIQRLDLQEGYRLEKGQPVGMIDTIPLQLKKGQLFAQRKLLLAKSEGVKSQVDVLEEQKKNLLIEKKRMENLLGDKAIPEKQLDDVMGNLRVLESQIISAETQLKSVLAEMEMLNFQILQLEDQVRRSYLINPLKGTVLEKYVEPFEMVTPGKQLYKIGSLDTMILRAYVSGDQLPLISVGKQVAVVLDKDIKENQSIPGIISWISNEAEFTPKIIQTKKERVNLVYAIKVLVPNDGRIKSGMPGEVNFNQ